MIQEITTSQSPAEVLAQAERFFMRRNPNYGAFLEKRGPEFRVFRGQGKEEIAIGVTPVEGGTRVWGSTYFFDAQVSRFFTTLAPAPVAEGVRE